MTAFSSSLLAVLVLASSTWAACPSSGYNLTPIQKRVRVAPGASGYNTAACTEAENDEARRNQIGNYSARPAASAAIVNKQYTVLDCLTRDCTAGGGYHRCETVVNDAGNAWVVGACQFALTAESFGARCGDATADTTAAQAMLTALGVLQIAPGCTLAISGASGQSLLLDAVGESIRCGPGGGLALSTKVCVGGNTPGGSCTSTGQCDGGTCSGTVFADTAVDRTLIKGTASNVSVEGCTLKANGIPHDGAGKGWASCSGGSEAGEPCRWTCSNDATKACDENSDCTPGTCTKRNACTGGTCGSAGLAPHGAGTVKLIDFSTTAYNHVRDVTVVDYVRGDQMIHIGAYSEARGVKMLMTAAALPTTGSPAHANPAVTFGAGLRGGLSRIVDNGPIWGDPAIYNACLNSVGIHCETSHNTILGGLHSNELSAAGIRLDGWHHRVIGNSVQGIWRHCVLGGTNATDVTLEGNRCLTFGVGPVVSAYGTGWEIIGNYLVGGGPRCQTGPNVGLGCQLHCVGGGEDGDVCGWDAQCPSGVCNADDDCTSGDECYQDQCVVGLGGTPDSFVSAANHSQVSNNLIGIGGIGGCGVGLVDGYSHTEIKVSDNEFLRLSASRETRPWNTAVRVAGNVDVLMLNDNYFGVRQGQEYEASPGTIVGVHSEGNTYAMGACSSTSSRRGEICKADAECTGGGTCEPDLAAPLYNWSPIFGAMLDRLPLPGLAPSGPGQTWMLYQGTGALYDAVMVSTSADHSVTRSTATTSRVVGIAVTTPVDGMPVLVQSWGPSKCKVSGSVSKGDDLVATNTAGTLATSGGSVTYAEVTKAGSGTVDCWVGG